MIQPNLIVDAIEPNAVSFYAIADTSTFIVPAISTINTWTVSGSYKNDSKKTLIIHAEPALTFCQPQTLAPRQ